MTNNNSQPSQIPATSDAPLSPPAHAPQSAEAQRSMLIAATQAATQMPTATSSAANLNTPLVGSLNAKPPLFYIKASAAQLKAIIQSAPEEVRSCIRANASKEVMLDEVFKLRQQEAIAEKDLPQETIDPQEAISKLLTIEPCEVSTAVDTNPEHVRKLMEAALQADSALTPRAVPDDRHNIIYTVLTWQVNAHKTANPSLPAPPCQQTRQAVQLPDQQPPQVNRNPNPTRQNPAISPVIGPQTALPNEQHGLTLRELIADGSAPAQRGGAHATDPQDVEDTDEELDQRRKRVRDQNQMKSWIEGFHTGSDAALEQTLSDYPENRPGANRLNVTTFRGPKILGKVISRNMGLQQHVATFPFWKKSASGRPSQPQMEAHNLARMMQLEILAHSSPLEALRHRPSLEVGLRRLYSIMYVEKQIATGEILDRGTAWQNIEFLLESTPSDISICDDIEEEMTRRLTQSKRRIAATKLIKESDNRRPKRGQNKGQANNQDANKRRTHGADNGDHNE